MGETANFKLGLVVLFCCSLSSALAGVCTKDYSCRLFCGWEYYRCYYGWYLCAKQKYCLSTCRGCCPGYKNTPACDTPLCFGAETCPNGGTCATPDSCLCQIGYSGQNCADIDECKGNSHGCSQKCENSKGSYKCLCQEGFELDSDGKTCKDIDFCKSSPCTNGGTCHDHLLNFTCDCPYGFAGDRCEKECNIDFNQCYNIFRCSRHCGQHYQLQDSTDCVADLCKDKEESLVLLDDKRCRTYIQCNPSGPATPMCCRPGRTFNATKGQCEHTNLDACIKEVCPEFFITECRKVVPAENGTAGNSTVFYDLDDIRGHIHTCPGGTEFSEQECACVHSSNTINSGDCLLKENPTNPFVYIDTADPAGPSSRPCPDGTEFSKEDCACAHPKTKKGEPCSAPRNGCAPGTVFDTTSCHCNHPPADVTAPCGPHAPECFGDLVLNPEICVCDWPWNVGK